MSEHKIYRRPVCKYCYSHVSNQTNTKSIIKTAAKFENELNKSTENNDTKEGIQHVKAKLCESLKKKLESKVIHGHYIISVDRQLTGAEGKLLWMSRGDLKGETGSEIMAAQDQVLQTKYHATKILQTETESKCRL